MGVPPAGEFALYVLQNASDIVLKKPDGSWDAEAAMKNVTSTGPFSRPHVR